MRETKDSMLISPQMRAFESGDLKPIYLNGNLIFFKEASQWIQYFIAQCGTNTTTSGHLYQQKFWWTSADAQLDIFLPKADKNFKTHKNKWSRRKMWNEASLLRLRKLNSNCLVSWLRSVLELGEDAWSSNIGIMLRPTAQCTVSTLAWLCCWTNWANVHNISTSCHSTILPHTWKLAASPHRSWNIPPLHCDAARFQHSAFGNKLTSPNLLIFTLIFSR